jgi:hypothetical protein
VADSGGVKEHGGFQKGHSFWYEYDGIGLNFKESSPSSIVMVHPLCTL